MNTVLRKLPKAAAVPVPVTLAVVQFVCTQLLVWAYSSAMLMQERPKVEAVHTAQPTAATRSTMRRLLPRVHTVWD